MNDQDEIQLQASNTVAMSIQDRSKELTAKVTALIVEKAEQRQEKYQDSILKRGLFTI